MTQPKGGARKRRLTAEQRESYAILRELRSRMMDQIRTFNRMMQMNHDEIEAHLHRYGDAQERASDGVTKVPGMYKMPMAFYTRASIKSLLESLVVLDQKLEVFEGTGDPDQEDERETRSGSEAAKRLLEAMDRRARDAALEQPQEPGKGSLASEEDEHEED